MSRSACAWTIVSAVALVVSQAGPDPATAGTFRLRGHAFTLPDGFEVELIAGPPLVDRPIVADFDEQGRLYVADSSGSNDKVEKQLAEKPHRILRLVDTDGDGRFDRRTVFAERMMFPEGALWFDGSLYVSAPPSIWKLTDSDGDGVAESRVEWFQGKTLTGCANDLHGPYLGPDGWIYWCKGAFARQTYERTGRKPFTTRAAHIFRARPDGSAIEPVMTGGMDNPVDVVVTPGGERIFTTTFLQRPGGGLRDGLIHAIYGGLYGKVNDVLDEHPHTSPDLMPVLSHFGPAAPCGLTRYDSEVFGPAYRDNLFACLFNMQKVTRHVLTPSGSTFTSKDEDFLVSDNKDFHPTDVLEDADGSLVVIDTGGWYKLCCPSSQLWKPDLLGGIYRIKRRGVRPVEDPRGLKLAWTTLTTRGLAGLLDDPRPAVRRRAIQALAAQGHATISALVAARSGRSAEARRNAVWTLTRMDDPDARAPVREFLADADETVRQVAIHSISVRRDRDAVPRLLEILQGRGPQNRRAAAEALGRIGDKAAVPVLLDVVGSPHDRALEHSLTYALIEIADPVTTAAGLKSPNPLTRRAALIALDQMEGGGLKPDSVARDLASSDPLLKKNAAWIVGRHPEWGDALAGFLRDRLAARGLSDGERAELAGQLARFARARAVQDLLANRVRDGSADPETRRTALRAMAQSGLKETPSPWVDALLKILGGGDAGLVREAVATVRALAFQGEGAARLGTQLIEIAGREANPPDLRLGALAAVPGGLPGVSPPLFAFLRQQLDPDSPVAARSAAADVLSRAKLTREQLAALTETIATAGPLEVGRLVAAFAQAPDEEIGLKLVAALGRSSAVTTLRTESLKLVLAKFPPRVQEHATRLYAQLDASVAQQRAQLERMLAALSSGDVRRGQAVFNSTKAACSSCHEIGYMGGHVGPDLTRIGRIRNGRDLLEAIAFPSASFVRSFEPVAIATRDGKVTSGVITKDAADEVVLATGVNQEARIARADIEEIRPSGVSVMPAGLDQQLTLQELADLVAFLQACQ